MHVKSSARLKDQAQEDDVPSPEVVRATPPLHNPHHAESGDGPPQKAGRDPTQKLNSKPKPKQKPRPQCGSMRSTEGWHLMLGKGDGFRFLTVKEDSRKPRHRRCLFEARRNVPITTSVARPGKSKAIADLFHGNSRARYDVCDHDADPDTPLYIRAVQGHRPQPSANPLYRCLCAHSSRFH